MSSKVLRPLLSGATASASIAAGLVGFFPGHAAGQESQSKPADAAVPLPPLTVEASEKPKAKSKKKKASSSAGTTASAATAAPQPVQTSSQSDGTGAESANALNSGTGLGRLPGTLQSTPQTVTVIPQKVLQQQQVSTINQALQNVPGITLATGEGGGGMNGDQFRIRGFDAKGDVYVDGLRDFGAYTRDSFATESVAVFKGPSSESFGNGSTGGIIELQSKTAHLGDANSIEGSIGTGPLKRSVIDVNKQISDTTAVRVVGMLHDQDIVDRDHVYSDRWGVLGSIGFGLGTDQTLTVNYLHQDGDRRPDMGVPIPYLPGVVTSPVTEYGVPRSNYFGKESDRDETQVDMLTVRYRGKVNDWLTISNDSRYAEYSRKLSMTTTMCAFAFPPFGLYANCGANVLAGNLGTPYDIWLVGGPRQDTSGGQNITTALANFHTGAFRHQAVFGIDTWYQKNDRDYLSAPQGATPGGTLLDPNFENPPGFQLTNSSRSKSEAWDVGLFASDRLWLTPQFSVLGGVRWDNYHAEIASTNPAGQLGESLGSKTQFTSPKLSVIWEPTHAETYYVSYAKSFTPQGADVATSFSFSPATQPNLKPDDNESYEVGAKWSLLDGRLGATAALFQVEKNNARYSDPLTGDSVTTGETQRVRGLELGLTGQITNAWTVQAAYTYMDSEILTSGPLTAFDPLPTAGNRVPYVSEHGASLWTTYDIATLLVGMPGALLVGAGVNYRSDYFADSSNMYLIPAATTIDGLVSYEVGDYRIALNGYNLTDELAYTSAFYYRAEVAPGRAFTLTASKKF